jgi:hypothetical protein
MDRDRTFTLVTAAVYVTVAVVVVGAILLFAGPDAPPDVQPPPALDSTVVLGALLVAPPVLGWALLRGLRSRYWTATVGGVDAALSTDGGGPLALEDYAGTVDGRTVTVRGGVEPHGSESSSGLTVIEAPLAGNAEEGVILEPTHDDYHDFELPEHADVRDEDLLAVGTSADLTEALTSGRAREAVVAAGGTEQYYAGDAAAAFYTYKPDEAGPVSYNDLRRVVLWAHDDETGKGDAVGGTDSVSTVLTSMPTDEAVLQAHIEAVVAVADAFEDAGGVAPAVSQH